MVLILHCIMEDFNIDLLQDYHSTVQYKNMLNYFNLHQHVQQPTCVKDKYGHLLIDRVISNFSNQTTYTNVLPYLSVSGHNAPYVCINICLKRFQPHYKMIRNEREFN